MTAQKRSTKPYTPAALFRVYDKTTGALLGYAAPSRDGEKTYHVTYNKYYKRWRCTCPATCECCHIKAVCELCEIYVQKDEARKQAVREVISQINTTYGFAVITMGAATFKSPVKFVDTKPVARIETAALNGRSMPMSVNRGSGPTVRKVNSRVLGLAS